MLKFMWKHGKTSDSQNNPKQKRNNAATNDAVFVFKLDYRATVTNTTVHRHKTKPVPSRHPLQA